MTHPLRTFQPLDTALAERIAAGAGSRQDDAAARRAGRNAALFETMARHVVDAIRAGRDERLPSVSIREPLPEGQRISEWLSNCDVTQEALLFQLVHLALNKASPELFHEAGEKLAQYVARDFAESFVAARS